MAKTRQDSGKAKAASMESAWKNIGLSFDQNGNILDPNGDAIGVDENGQPKIMETIIKFGLIGNVNMAAAFANANNSVTGNANNSTTGNATVNGNTPKRTAQAAGFAALPTRAEAEMEEQLAYVNKRAKKGIKADDNMGKLIHTTIKNKTMRKIKFAHGESKQRHALEVLKDLNLGPNFTGDTPEAKAKQQTWVKAYVGTCTSKLNGLRNYAQARVQNAANKWMDTHNGMLPTLRQLEDIINRKLDPKNQDHMELMIWWVEDVLPMAAGNQFDWSDEKKYYVTVSNGAPPDAPSQKYVPPSTEAIAVAFIENCRTRWEKVWELKSQHTYPGRTKFVANPRLEYKVTTDTNGNQTVTNELAYEIRAHPTKTDTVQLNDPKYQGQYTRTDLGQSTDSGWTKAGRKAFMRWKNANKAARETQQSTNLEEEALKLMRERKGIKAENATEERLRLRREQHKAAQEDDEESDVEMEFDE